MGAPFTRRAGPGCLLIASACTLAAPPLDYAGLACGVDDPCGGGLQCLTTGICGVPPAGSSTGSGRGASGGSSGGSTGGGSSTGGTTGAGTTGASGTSSGGGTAAGSLAEPLLAIGRAHACDVVAGGVECWGNDRDGQLGNGTLASTWSPVGVPNLTGVTAVAAGGNQSCALENQAAVCWGDQSAGSTSENLSYATQPTYVDTTLLFGGVTSIALGLTHGCAAHLGRALCWGGNGEGQIGNGSFNAATTPTTVSGLQGVLAVAAGDFHSCALVDGGSIYCWGANVAGQLGTGVSGNPETSPQPVSGLGPYVAVSAGSSHTCALTAAGSVQCWGSNASGQLGTTFEPSGSALPVPVELIDAGFTGVAAGGNHSCALAASGAVYCWGDDSYGELGDGADGGQSATPVQVAGLTAAIAIAAGQVSSCAELDGGAVLCWGYGGEGELGNGSIANSTLPAATTPDAGTPDGGNPSGGTLAGGIGSMFAIDADGGVLAWGGDLEGQLGNASRESSAVPIPVNLGPVLSLAASADHACAVTQTGGVLCWGSNVCGQLGNGTTTRAAVPVSVPLAASATAVACGGSHSCAVAGGAVYCWGENPYGELGNGSTTPSSTPVAIPDLASGVTSVVAAQNVSCAVAAGGDLFCWGANPEGLLGNGSGQIGNGNAVPSTVPVQVTHLGSGVLQASIGATHGCALVAGGGVQCWGDDFFGELGDGNTVAQSAPIQVLGLTSGVEAVAVGTHHSCALLDGGGIECWGRGSYGEMGDGAAADVNANPVAVSGLSGATTLAAGDESTCALVGGRLFCWGYGGDGSLGNGGLANAPTPVPAR